MAHVGVILSGCGVFDGSEIHEAVLTLLCLDQRGASYQCMAVKKPSAIVNHLTKEAVEGETRNVLTESARIARGEIVDLATVQGDEFDAFVLPGGFGAAKNLCTFATKGADCEADPQVLRVLSKAQLAGKPLGFACIAPALAARVFGQQLSVQLTIGHDSQTAAGLEAMGAKHIACDADDVVIDEAHRIVTTPAYMEANSLSQLYTGIDKMVAQILAWTGEPASV